MRKIVVTAALVAALVAVGQGCKRVNGAYCDDARPCGAGSSCDLVARECRPSTIGGGGDLGGGGGGGGACGQCGGTTPLCTADVCIPCTSTSDGDGACSALSPSTPHCASDGSCVGCRDGNDCGGTTPFCDATTHQCRGCILDSECPSLICDLTPGSTTRGLCVDASKVVYVDPAGSDGDGLTPATAKRKLQDGLNLATSNNVARPYVHVAAATYSESVGSMVKAHPLYLVGATGATIKAPTGDAVGVSGGASLTLRNIIATGTAGHAVNCQQAGSTFAAYRSQLINSGQDGIYAGAGCTILVDSCFVHNNTGGGINVNGNFTVINTIITKSGGTGGFYQTTAGLSATFVNNTVADALGSTTYGGVTCAAATSFQVINSILYNNKGTGGIAETNCGTAFIASDDPAMGPQSTVDLTLGAPMFKATVPVSADSYHLQPGSRCINEGTPTGAPDHDYDFEPRPDRTSMKIDIGADEVQ